MNMGIAYRIVTKYGMFQMFFRFRFLQWVKGPGVRWATSMWETLLYNGVDLAIAMAGAAFLYALARDSIDGGRG